MEVPNSKRDRKLASTYSTSVQMDEGMQLVSCRMTLYEERSAGGEGRLRLNHVNENHPQGSVNIMNAHAPWAVCEENEKGKFWAV